MRRRILVSIVGVTAVAVVVFGVPLALAASRLYRSREVSRLQREATLTVASVPPAGLHGPDAIELPATKAPLVVGLYDTTHRLVVGRGPSDGGHEVGVALSGRIAESSAGSWLAVAVPVVDDEQIVGAARAAVPSDTITDPVERAWAVMAGLGTLALALAAGLGGWQARRLSRPIGDVTAAAERLGHGDFGARLNRYGIDDIDRAAEAMDATAARLGDLVARERAFSSNASHQLNTPVTSVRLGLESALMTPGADKKAAIAEAVAELERLQQTISGLLALTRDQSAVAGSCAPAVLCDEARERWNGPLAAAGRPLRLEVDPDVPSVRCSADALRETLQVLLDNASRHGRGAVAVRARRAGTGAVIEVQDEGDGFSGDAEALFSRRSSDANGHGIGLALARSLVEANGGRLVARSTGRGPVFTIALPGAGAGADVER